MGNFEKLSVLVIVVIIVMILVVALYTWTDSPADATMAGGAGLQDPLAEIAPPPIDPPAPAPEKPTLIVKPEVPPSPTPPPAPPPTPPAEERPVAREHVIAAGDTLEKISKRHYGTIRHVGALERANPGVDPMRLRLGQKLVVPEISGTAPSAPSGERVASGAGPASPGGVYTVRRGDSLPEISRRAYGKIDRWHEIWLANFERIDDPDRLASGTRLSLPK
jgi:nucleoid-associated protein YgaU